MCESTTDDMDKYFAYELSKDSGSMIEEGEEEEYDDQEFLVINDDEDEPLEEHLLEDNIEFEEIEPKCEPADVSAGGGEEMIEIIEDDDVGELEADDEDNDQDSCNVDEADVDKNIDEAQLQCQPIEQSPRIKRKSSVKTEKATTPRGPRRYMLFDDLIATIVDYDEDNTPIVEFSMSGLESDEKLPVECGICPDVMHKSKLAKHLRTHLVPGTTNRYACIYCEETYRDCKYLAGHARRHMGIRPYVCEICKLYFSTKQDLRVHNQRRHLEKEHICEICGKTFAQNTQLKRHREATHEKKRRFQCEYCPKAYYKNFSLQEHVRNVHMGKRRMLVCPFCGMQCRDAHKMARHRKEMHLNQTHFVCYVCQEEFTDINYFDAHKRSIQCRSNTRLKIKQEEEDQKLVQPQEEADPEYEGNVLVERIADDEEELIAQEFDGALVYEITLETEEN